MLGSDKYATKWLKYESMFILWVDLPMVEISVLLTILSNMM